MEALEIAKKESEKNKAKIISQINDDYGVEEIDKS